MQTRNLFDLFLESRKLMSCSPETLRFYRGRLGPLVEQFGDREFASLTLAEFTAWLQLRGSGRSSSTQHLNAVALQALHAFAVDQGILDRPLFRKLPKPPMGNRARLPSEIETKALLAKARTDFRVIYSALRQCGARPSELCGATIEQVDWRERAIVLQKHKTSRKTGRPRKIPIGEQLGKLLKKTIGKRTSGPIFIRKRTGTAWTVPALSGTYRRLRQRAGLPDDLVLYLARHEAGTRICRLSGVEQARQTLGHSSSQTTSRYVHFSMVELAGFQDSGSGATFQRETPVPAAALAPGKLPEKSPANLPQNSPADQNSPAGGEVSVRRLSERRKLRE